MVQATSSTCTLKSLWCEDSSCKILDHHRISSVHRTRWMRFKIQSQAAIFNIKFNLPSRTSKSSNTCSVNNSRECYCNSVHRNLAVYRCINRHTCRSSTHRRRETFCMWVLELTWSLFKFIKLTFFQQSTSPRVKFAPETIAKVQSSPSSIQPLALQRSKSMTSAEITLSRGMANLGLGLSAEDRDIGTFPPEVMAVITKASDDPNQLTARCLMELATHCMNRAVEGRR